MNFEEMAKKYPHLKPMLEQLAELDKKDELADEKAAQLEEKAKKEREEAEARAQKMQLEAEDWRAEKAARIESREMLNAVMALMCTALMEKDAEIQELKNDFKSTLERALPSIADDDTEKLVTDHLQQLEPAPDEEEEAEIPTLDEEVAA